MQASPLPEPSLSVCIFFSGLRYHYYSTKMNVGTDSSGYYAFASPGWDASIQYKNAYHFISVPLGLEVQPIKAVPLNVSATLSVQQLLHTNALVYDADRKAYVNDKDAFVKTQLFAEMGLNYALSLGTKKLALGPQISYGLSRLEQNRNKNLFYLRLNTQLHF